MRVTNRELRRRIRKILLNESYSSATLVNKYDDIDDVVTYSAEGELATEIMSSIIGNTNNFGQVFEVVMAQILESEKGYSCTDLNPSVNSGDLESTAGGGVNSEFADIAANLTGEAKSENYDLQDLQDTILISAKSVKGPFEFTGPGKPTKLVKLVKRILDDTTLNLSMPVDGISIQYAPAYAALDLKNTQKFKRLVYDVQIALPKSVNGKIISKSLTNITTGVDTSDAHIKSLVFDRLYDSDLSNASNKAKKLGAVDSMKTLLGFVNASLPLKTINANGATRAGGDPVFKTFSRMINEYVLGNVPKSGSGAALNYKYDTKDKAGQVIRPKNIQLVEEIKDIVETMMASPPDISGEFAKMKSPAYIGELDPKYDPTTSYDILTRVPTSPDDFISEVNQNSRIDYMDNLYENILVAYTKKVYDALLRGQNLIEYMQGTVTQKVLSSRIQQFSNLTNSLGIDLQNITPEMIYNIIKQNTPKEKMQLHEDSIGLKYYYISRVKELGKQDHDLTEDENVPQPASLKSRTQNIQGAIPKTIDDVVSSDDDWALCSLNSAGQIIKMGSDIDPVSGFSTFLTSLMTSGYEYSYYKVIVDIDPQATKSLTTTPEALDDIYYKAIENVVISARVRLGSGKTRPRRSYTSDISKSPRSFDANDAQKATDWVVAWFNKSFVNIEGADNSRLNRLSSLLQQLIALSSPTPQQANMLNARQTQSRLNLTLYIQEEFNKALNGMVNELQTQLQSANEEMYSTVHKANLALRKENIMRETLNEILPDFRLTVLKYAHTIYMYTAYAGLNPTEVGKFLDDQIKFLEPFVEALSESDEQMSPSTTGDILPDVMDQQPLDQPQQVQTESRIYENILKKILYTAKKRR